MTFTKTLCAATAIVVAGSSASAGGLPPVVIDTPTVVVDAPAPAGSINPGFVVLGLLAALVAASGSF